MNSRIITFYSYKGGTGRSMSLANTAWILASNGKRILVVDWDLEAPGLHRYFHPFLPDHELRSSPGVMDLVWEFATAAMDPATPDEPAWHERLAEIEPYAMSVEHAFPGQGTIDFVPAGRQDDLYSTLVTTFDWSNFYERLGGGGFIEALKRGMRERYDYILIDSRTGLSDTAGICTVQLPDMLVNCFSLSTQAIDGAEAVAASVHRQRAGDQPRMFPVPMRVDDGEQDKLESSRDYARAKFGRYLSHVPDPDGYWGDVEVPYKPFYAYEEILATVGDRPRQQDTVLAATERIVAHLTDQEITRLVTDLDEPGRRALLERFQRVGPLASDRLTPDRRRQPSSRVFISYSYDSIDHFEAVRELWFLLRGHGINALLDRAPGQRRPDWRPWQREQLLAADTVVVVPSPAYRRQPTDDVKDLREAYRTRPQRFVRVVLPGGTHEDLPDFLRGVASTRWAEVRALTAEGVEPLAELILRQVSAVRPSGSNLVTSRPTRNVRNTDPELVDAADALSYALIEEQHMEVRHRRLTDPYPLPLRWSLNSFLSADNGPMTSTSGDLLEETGDPFASLPSGRLVLVGPPGSGKTSAAILLTLRLLQNRTSLQPVPVLLPMASWDPTTQTLQDWIVDRLWVNHAVNRIGRGTAQRLVNEDLILPVLDGLDELPAPLRAAALEALRRSIPPDGMYVMTSRIAEYESSVLTTGRLPVRTTVLTLEPLHSGDVIAHLARNRLPNDMRWEPVLHSLLAQPSGPLARTLTQPLMLQLAVEIYRAPSAHPAELLEIPDEKSIHTHLLNALLPALYDPFPTSDRHDFSPFRARRWLTFLATHLERQQTHELTWWEIHRFFAPGRMRLLLGWFCALLTAPGLVLVYLTSTPLDAAFPDLRPTVAALTGAAFATVMLTVVRSPSPRRALRVLDRRFYPSLTRLTRPVDQATTSPRASLRADRRATLLPPLLTGSGLAAVLTGVTVPSEGFAASVLAGLLTFMVTTLLLMGLSLRSSASGRYAVTVLWLALRGQLPWRLMSFLDDAHRRGVLRRTGAAYQFRHRLLQQVLAEQAKSGKP
ncbi:KGGVGR-motif variant AAA ATPase [Streptomyces avermitilis]